MNKEDKRFLQKLYQRYKDKGQIAKLRKDIQALTIPESDKALLLSHYVDGLPFKTVGVVLAELENLAEPLSERQVHRRHDKAIERAVEAILQGFV